MFWSRFRCKTSLAWLVCACLFARQSIAAVGGSGVIDVGSAKQLFLDERLIESSRGVRLQINTPYTMQEPVLVADQPWENPKDSFVWSYSSVMKVNGKVRIWYQVNKLDFKPQPVGFVVTDKWLAYAESGDGIHFTKPKLGLNEYRGSRANNIVISGVEGGAVWIDPNGASEHRFRFQTYSGTGKLAFFSAPDGIRWKKTHTARIGHNDTQNIVFWDPAVERYLLFTRKWPGNLRVHRRLDSHDLIYWKNEAVVMSADDTDRTKFKSVGNRPVVDYYGACVFKYPDEHGLFVMLPQAFWQWYARKDKQRPGPNLYDVRLCVSRDGRKFSRVANRGIFLRPGQEGTFYSGSVWVLPSPIRMGNELWFYFQGSTADHDGNLVPGSNNFRTGIGRAILRLDGFVSVDAGFSGGELVTPLIKFTGNSLILNVNSSGGGVARVELLDEKDQPIPGFTKNDATPLAPPGAPRLEETSIDLSVLAFTLSATVVTGLLVGLLPALRVAAVNLNDQLKSASRTATQGQSRLRMGSVLVVAELSTTLVLLVGAGLLIKSFAIVMQIDPGFETRNRLSLSMSLPAAKHVWNYNSEFNHRVVDQVSALPGVKSAAVITGMPMSGTNIECSMVVEEREWADHDALPPARIRVITDDYFTTMGIRLIRGRFFRESDGIGSIGYTKSVIINETAAKWGWPNQDPLGKRFKVAKHLDQWMQVVGVVGDASYSGLDQAMTADIYYPEKLFPQFMTSLVVHTSTDPLTVANNVRSAILDVDPDAYVTDMKSMHKVQSESLAQRRFTMLLLAAFAVISLILAVTGTYGVIAYSISRRTQEIGIRMALGATMGNVVWMLMRQGLVLVLLGIGIGAICAALISGHLESSLFAVSTQDVTVFASVAALLAGSALVACLLAARRAMIITPIDALRCE